jgi:hypothetical protein
MAIRPATLQNLLLPAAIVLLTAAVYANTLSFGFVHDDWGQIVGASQIASWHNIPSFFTGHVWSWKSPGSAGTYYRLSVVAARQFHVFRGRSSGLAFH